MTERTFFDIHMHAFNLSHPSISTFIRRSIREFGHSLWRPRQLPRMMGILLVAALLGVLWSILFLVSLLPFFRRPVRHLISLLWRVGRRALRPVENLLAVMESDIGSGFLLMEDCLRDETNQLLRSEGLRIGGETYGRVVLTPLMMDFGYKGRAAPGEAQGPRFRYDKRGGKPVVEQVIDVFGAIRTYLETESDERLTVKYPGLGPGTERVFEIYPFLALNPANYPIEKIEQLLDKYFNGYTGRRAAFRATMGTFDGSIAHLGVHAFAGIKVYPPLGFDPWPASDRAAMEKIRLLYRRCSEQGIPITTHGGSGGFAVLSRDELRAVTSVDRWKDVLCRFPDLKLNLAHFPMSRLETRRQQETLALVMEYENLYVDISCRATSETYYKRLRDLLNHLDGAERAQLASRLLFGSDFAVNLMWIDSYNSYLDLFSRTPSLSADEKLAMCSTNPERFLFDGAVATHKPSEASVTNGTRAL